MNEQITSTDVLIASMITKLDLVEARKEKKLTQKDIANMTGLSIACISDIESPNGNPTMKSLIKYLECLDLEIGFKKKSI